MLPSLSQRSNVVLLLLFASLAVNLLLLSPWRGSLIGPRAQLAPCAGKAANTRGVVTEAAHQGEPREQEAAQPLSSFSSLWVSTEASPTARLQAAGRSSATTEPSIQTSAATLQRFLTLATSAALRTEDRGKGSPVLVHRNGSSFLTPCPSGSTESVKESVHRRGLESRARYWQSLNAQLTGKREVPWSASDPRMSPAFIHWSVEPTWTCHVMQRYGQLGDGGKEMCDAGRLLGSPAAAAERARGSPPPLIYSFGSKLECDFERELKADYPHCEVHVFDPTPGVVEGFPASRCASIVAFHGSGLGGYSTSVSLNGINHYPGRSVPLRSLLAIQASLGHQRRVIDVLKIDIEGSEFDAFAHLAANARAQNWPGAKLIMLEVHLFENLFPGGWLSALQAFQKLFSDFQAMGYRVYYKEINPYEGRKCVEYALINEKYLF